MSRSGTRCAITGSAGPGVTKVDLADLLRVHTAGCQASAPAQGHQRLGGALTRGGVSSPPRPGPAARPGPRAVRAVLGLPSGGRRPVLRAGVQAPETSRPKPKRRGSSGCSASAPPRPGPRPSGPAARQRPRAVKRPREPRPPGPPREPGPPRPPALRREPGPPGHRHAAGTGTAAATGTGGNRDRRGRKARREPGPRPLREPGPPAGGGARRWTPSAGPAGPSR